MGLCDYGLERTSSAPSPRQPGQGRWPGHLAGHFLPRRKAGSGDFQTVHAPVQQAGQRPGNHPL